MIVSLWLFTPKVLKYPYITAFKKSHIALDFILY